MKKLISILVCLCLLACLATAVSGAEILGAYTSDSEFEVGSTVTVDEMQTLENLYDYATSDAYNAYLDGNVSYIWYRYEGNNSGWAYSEGPYLYLTADNAGWSFFCRIFLFSDMGQTEQCGVYDCPHFTVSYSNNPALYPEILTEYVPDGCVGSYYSCQLESSDPDVTYSLFRSNLPDGLTLSSTGEIYGTPEEYGDFYFVVMIQNDAGDDNYMEYSLYIEDAGEYSLELCRAPDKVVYTAGETLDMSGLWIRIWYPDGGFFDARDGDYMLYSQNPLVTLGEQKIKVAFEDKAFTFFIVTVVEPESTEPEPTEPEETEPEDASGTVEIVPVDPIPDGSDTLFPNDGILIAPGPGSAVVEQIPASSFSLGSLGLLGIVFAVILGLLGLLVVLALLAVIIILIIVIVKKAKKKKAANN